MTTITLNGKPIAQGYLPSAPPPPAILADWKRASGSTKTTAQLTAELRTGQPVELVAGVWLVWGNDVEN